MVIVGNNEDDPPNAYAAKLDEDGTFLWDWKVTSKPRLVGATGRSLGRCR